MFQQIGMAEKWYRKAKLEPRIVGIRQAAILANIALIVPVVNIFLNRRAHATVDEIQRLRRYNILK